MFAAFLSVGSIGFSSWILSLGDGTSDLDVQIVVETVFNESKIVQINDYEALRQLFATLLAEIQRIKSEGDFDACRQLVEQYAVKVDPELHAEVLERYQKLNLAPYKGFINPRMEPVMDKEGRITDIRLDYTETFAQQNMRYSKEYATL